jgi:hypothetical protein
MGRMKEFWIQQLEDAEPESPDEGDYSELCARCMYFHVSTHECVTDSIMANGERVFEFVKEEVENNLAKNPVEVEHE